MREALRQQMLLRALWRDAPPAVVEGWLAGTPQRKRRALQVYQANAGALAERALGAAYPTLRQGVGEASFAALARAYWHAHPPEQGDVGEWGESLAAFVAAAPSLADEAYLADLVRLEWAMHRAERAADDDADPSGGLLRLADSEPDRLRLRLRAGTALIDSAHPVVSIWQAHRSEAPDRFEPVRRAFQRGQGEAALVHREGCVAQVTSIGRAEARFVSATLAGASLGQALAAGGEDFDFEAWLIQALRGGWLAAVETIDPKGSP